jgi:hypothetical protein
MTNVPSALKVWAKKKSGKALSPEEEKAERARKLAEKHDMPTFIAKKIAAKE